MEEKKVRIALLGLGSVGSKVVENLMKQKEKIRKSSGYTVELVYGYVRSTHDPVKQQLAKDYHFTLTDSMEEILADETIDVVIELMGRVHPAKSFIEQALKSKKSVITANKDVIAQYGFELNQLAIDSGVWLVYEASVAGGIPIVDTLETHFSFDEVTEITGILNGTTNYILTKMFQNELSYDEALSQAQVLGFAESDPTNDVEGIDAAYKVMVLAQLAFQTYIQLSNVHIKGISTITLDQLKLADQFGYRIKLLGQLQKKEAGFYFRVEPFLVPKDHLLANINQETNALSIISEEIGQTFISGPGAGPAPTATSILADLFRLIITKENMKSLSRDTDSQKVTVAEIPQNSMSLLSNEQQKNRYGSLVCFDSKKERSEEAILKMHHQFIQSIRSFEDFLLVESTDLTQPDCTILNDQLCEWGTVVACLPIIQ